MLGVDTNVLVRFLVRDDDAQFEKARKLIKREIAAGRCVFVSQLVLLETLRSKLASLQESPHTYHEGGHHHLSLKPVQLRQMPDEEPMLSEHADSQDRPQYP